MARPESRRRGGAEAEDVAIYRQRASEAATAYRDYIITGNDANRQTFERLYRANSERREFMSAFTQEIESVRQDARVRPLWEAFRQDRQRLEPAVTVDFINTVRGIRVALASGRPSDRAVTELTRRVQRVRESSAEGRERIPVRPDTPIGRVMAAMAADSGLELDTAVRAELRRTSLADAEARYGQRLTRALLAAMPEEQARLAVSHLREFILTGDTVQRDSFRRIFDANPGQDFFGHFSTFFRQRIYGTGARPSGELEEIARSYYQIMNGIEPREFATLVTNMYNLARSGTRSDIDTMVNRFMQQVLGEGNTEEARSRMGSQVVDRLLEIVARGQADHAIRMMRQVLATGSSEAATSFAGVYNGRFLGAPIVQNQTFWRRFIGLYRSEIDGSAELSSIVRGYGRNILPIAIRDIAVELARSSPDMDRLRLDYGNELISLVQGNIRDFSWIFRSGPQVERELERRAGLEDSTATRIRGMRVSGRGQALADTYTFLLDERMSRRSIAELETLERNFEQLSWLAGTPQAVQREIDRRARAREPDALAVAFRTAHSTNAGQVLSQAYAELSRLRARRAALIEAHGQEFLTYVERNLDNLHWVVRPVEQIESGLRSRGSDATVRQLQRDIGHTYGTLASALRDIYANVESQRSRLVSAYGEPLVSLVESNRSELGWLSGNEQAVETQLQTMLEDRSRTDQLTRSLRARTYSYSPVQLISALARARQAATRGGIARLNASEALGTLFMRPVLSRAVEAAPTLSPEGTEQGRRELVSRSTRIASDIESLNRQLRYDILSPARALLAARIRRWRIENERIRSLAATTYDEAGIQALRRDQTRLANSILEPGELRRAVEMAFSMVHVAETGGDSTRVASLPGTVSVDVDSRELSTLISWYRGLSGTGKQAVIEEVVASVLYQADAHREGDRTTHPLYDFITSMNQRGYFDAVQRVYAVTQRRGSDTRADMVTRYGEAFVRMVEAQAGHLRFLSGPSASRQDLRQLGERDVNLQAHGSRLFADMVIRCHRALANPEGDENRARMVTLYGEQFVGVIEQNAAQLAPLSESGAGLEEVRALPESVRRALMAAYPSAYRMSATGLRRAFEQQEEPIFHAMGAIYEVLRRAPARDASREIREQHRRQVQALEDSYGQELVRLVRSNMSALRFLERPSSQASDIRNVEEGLRERIYAAFESGPGGGRARFMQNLEYVANAIPGVYSRIRNSLLFSSPTDTLGQEFERAVQSYRDIFGENNYLFNLYFNLDTFRTNLDRIASHYRVTIPDYLRDDITPEELARFLRSEEGVQLLRAGRTFYRQVDQETRRQRTATGFSPTEGDLTDTALQSLPSDLTVIDALFMGMAMERISGTDSSFQRAAASELMNTLLVISHRDPYLIGPYLTQVLPALLQVSQDQRTLIMGMSAFREMFTQRYSEGQRAIAYSNSLNRRYFLEVFRRIGSQLPAVTSTFDHNRLSDELRLVPEPGQQGDQSFMSPLLYRYRQGWWQMQDQPVPMLYGQQGEPLSLLPDPTYPRTARLPIGTSLTIDSGAMGLFSNMYDQLRPPAERLFRGGVPARYRIGALGASTIVRRINQLFGAMPSNFQDYWLSGAGQAGAYYALDDSGEGRRAHRGGVGADAAARSIAGGERGRLTYERTETETERVTTTVTPGQAPEEETTTTSASTDRIEYRAQAAGLPSPLTGPVPLPLLDLVPYNLFRRGSGTGIHRLREEFTYESTSGPVSGEDTVTSRRTRGHLESLLRIAAGEGGRSPTDMLVFFSGEHVPELRGPPSYRLTRDDLQDMNVANPSGVDLDRLNYLLYQMRNGENEAARAQARTDAEAMLTGIGTNMQAVERQSSRQLQEGRGRLQSRLFFITREGNIYQIAYGADTEAQLRNYLYAGMNRQDVLTSLRFVGRNMAPSAVRGGEDMSTAAGFDGAAVGFTIPRGRDEHGGDSVSALLFGQLVRNLSTMDPVHVEQAAGAAITQLLQSRRQRDAYAAFYRGAQVFDVDPADSSRITSTRMQGTGEFMWRRMRIDPMAHSMELRAVGGYPATAGVRWRHEIPTSRRETYGYGATAAYTDMDLMREFRVVNDQADDMYTRMRSYLVDLYGWNEDQARESGWLIAANYMYGTISDRATVDGSQITTETADHYATLLTMYWVNRHRLFAAGQRMPRGMTGMYDRIERAMLQIQRDPDNEDQIISQLTQALRQDFNRDVWRFALGWGYDGERVRAYTVASGQLDDERTYGNLYGLALIGRPTRVFTDILGHFYSMGPTVISEDSNGDPTVQTGNSQPWLDLYSGIGIMDWPSASLMRYQNSVTVSRAVDAAAALRDTYMERGSSSYNNQRLIRNYGQGFMELVESSGNQLEWMLRPESEVVRDLRTRAEAGEDPIIRRIMAQVYGDRIDELTAADYTSAGRMLLDIYREVRRTAPDMDRLNRQYSSEVVTLVRMYGGDLDWILLPQDRIRTMYQQRARSETSIEHRLGAAIRLPAAPTEAQLNGQELQRLVEQNLPAVVQAITDAPSRRGLLSDRYDVILGPRLQAEMQAARAAGREPPRHDTYYVMLSRVAERAEARGSIVIGTEADYTAWQREDRTIGRGVTRLEISRSGEDYSLTFSGDRRLRAFTAARLIGGVTLPLDPDEYERYQVGGNWTVGGLVHMLQDHQNDWLMGALYGVREYGNRQWSQLTISSAVRHQLANTATYQDQVWWYVFFNRTTGNVVLGSSDVFENEAEMRDVCTRLGCDITELQRTTGGGGVTWARTDIISGTRLSLHFFFEGGMERQRDYDDPQTVSGNPVVDWQNQFVFRSGLSLGYQRQQDSRVLGSRYYMSIVGQRGWWPMTQGEIGRPEYLNTWMSDITGRGTPTSIMLQVGGEF